MNRKTYDFPVNNYAMNPVMFMDEIIWGIVAGVAGNLSRKVP
jgi:hypothetical protein